MIYTNMLMILWFFLYFSFSNKKTLANFGLKNQLKFFDIFYAIDFNFKSIFQSKLYPTCRQEPPINSRIMEFFGMDSGLTGST